MKRSTIPVAIVGGGPVGLVLALFLDLYGVRSVLFDSEEGQRAHPKGSTQNARTLEHFRRLGISEPVRQLGLPADHPTDVAYFTRFNAWELARIRMPSEAEKMRAVAAAPATDQVPEPILRANQMYVEALLLDHARTRPNITLRFGWQVDHLATEADGAVVEAVKEQRRRARMLARQLCSWLRRRPQLRPPNARRPLSRLRCPAAAIHGRPHDRLTHPRAARSSAPSCVAGMPGSIGR